MGVLLYQMVFGKYPFEGKLVTIQFIFIKF